MNNILSKICILFCIGLASSMPDHHKHHKPPHYHYGYKVHGDYHKTNFGHSEKRNGYHTQGEYYVHLPDGRIQTVHYHVDDAYSGYIADVKYSGKAHHAPHKPHHGYH